MSTSKIGIGGRGCKSDSAALTFFIDDEKAYDHGLISGIFFTRICLERLKKIKKCIS
jgi:hypothetical protein